MNPKVTVIVPNYNHYTYLPRRLQSIAEQTYRNFEIILLDDASTDGSERLLENFAREHEDARLVINEHNSGTPFAQWNKGVEMARGEFIWIAESDDFAAPELLEKLVPMLEENPSVGIAYGQSYLVDEQSEVMHSYEENLKFIYKTDAWKQDFVKPGPQVCREWLLFHNPIPNASGILMRKTAYQQAGWADTSMRLNGDWHLYAKILVDNDLAFKARHLNYFRFHTGSQRTNARSRASTHTEVLVINNYIRENVENSTTNADAALPKVASWWMGNLPYHARNADNRAKNRQLYNAFKEHVPHLRLKIIKAYVFIYTRDFIRATGLLAPLKKLRKWLFPRKYFHK